MRHGVACQADAVPMARQQTHDRVVPTALPFTALLAPVRDARRRGRVATYHVLIPCTTCVRVRALAYAQATACH